MPTPLETPRLLLRPWLETDAHDLFAIMHSPSVRDGGWKPHTDMTESAAVLRGYLTSDDRFAVVLKETGHVIGSIRLTPDNNRGRYRARMLNYVLAEEFRGNGYMTEAVMRVVQYVFADLDMDLISAFHYKGNERSRNVLMRCGFSYEITIPGGCRRYDGAVLDAVCYSVLNPRLLR